MNPALSVDRPYVLSPKTPEGNLAVLRKAWDDMLRDPELLAEAARRKWPVAPTSYREIESFYHKAVAELTPEIVAELKLLFP